MPHRCHIVITLYGLLVFVCLLLLLLLFWGWGGGAFPHKTFYFIFLISCIQGNIFLSLDCLSLPLFP